MKIKQRIFNIGHLLKMLIGAFLIIPIFSLLGATYFAVRGVVLCDDAYVSKVKLRGEMMTVAANYKL